MTTCRTEQTVNACFAPTAGGSPVSILHTTVFTALGVPLAAYFHDTAANIINPMTFMGGGTATVGACALPADPIYSVIGGGINIAGPARASTAEFTGAVDVWSTSAVPGTLHSLTVAARSITDALPGQSSDQVIVDMPDGSNYTLMNGETRTFSVARDIDIELKREYLVTATGLAYANITYTYV